jgi:hypothetical protein
LIIAGAGLILPRLLGFQFFVAVAANQVGVGLGPGVHFAHRAGVSGLADRFLLTGGGVAVACAVVVKDGRCGGKVSGAASPALKGWKSIALLLSVE